MTERLRFDSLVIIERIYQHPITLLQLYNCSTFLSQSSHVERKEIVRETVVQNDERYNREEKDTRRTVVVSVNGRVVHYHNVNFLCWSQYYFIYTSVPDFIQINLSELLAIDPYSLICCWIIHTTHFFIKTSVVLYTLFL